MKNDEREKKIQNLLLDLGPLADELQEHLREEAERLERLQKFSIIFSNTANFAASLTDEDCDENGES